MPISKKRKRNINQNEILRRKKQANVWHIITHPNEEYEKAEKNRRISMKDNDILSYNEKISCLN